MGVGATRSFPRDGVLNWVRRVIRYRGLLLPEPVPFAVALRPSRGGRLPYGDLW